MGVNEVKVNGYLRTQPHALVIPRYYYPLNQCYVRYNALVLTLRATYIGISSYHAYAVV